MLGDNILWGCVLTIASLSVLFLAAWRALQHDRIDYSDDPANNAFVDVDAVIHRPWVDHRGNFNVKELDSEESWLESDKLTRAQTIMAQHYLKGGRREGTVFNVCSGYEDQVREASLELLDMIVKYYSQYHSSRRVADREGDLVRNHCTGTVHDLQQTHPLIICRLISGEDCVLMLRDKTNPSLHILAAAVICYPDDWLLEHKIGLPLSAIHYPVHSMNTSGETRERHALPAASPMLRIMEKFFDELYQEGSQEKKRIFKRFNYTFQSHDCQTNRFDFWLSWLAVRAIDILLRDSVYLRTERQTLRLLPASQAVAFLVKTKVTPLGEAISTQAQAVELAQALRQQHGRENSGKGRFKSRVMRYLSRRFELLEEVVNDRKSE